jgi:hypothetical protein
MCFLIIISLIHSNKKKYSYIERDFSRIECGSPRVEFNFSYIERGVLGRIYIF